jgi:RES domain-containing protein
VYTAESRALALLEQLVHFDADIIPAAFVVIRVEVPDGVIEGLDAVPPHWRDTGPGLAWTTTFGNQWLAERRSLALRVPSVVVPDERNLLINPNHPDFAIVNVGPARPFDIDPRLLPRR